MPSLIIEQPGKRSGGTVEGRVLIGRLPTNGILVNGSSVSRLHAWIDADPDGRYFVADSGSLTGTYVNGRTIEKRRILADGDVIRIGEAQIVFSLEDTLPDGVEPVDLSGQPPGQNVEEAGVLFDCPCGAPMWFKATTIGQGHTCRHCGRTIQVPDRSGVIAQEIAPPVAVTEPGVPPQPAGSAATQLAPGAARHAAVHDEHGLGEAAVATATATATATLIEHEEQPFEVSEQAHSRGQEPGEEPSNGDSYALGHGISDEVLTPSSDQDEQPAQEAPPPEVQPQAEVQAQAQAEPEPEAVGEAASPLTEPLPDPAAQPLAEPMVEATEPQPPPEPQPAADDAPSASPAPEPTPGRGWDFAFLLIDLIGAAFSALAYGVPSLIGAIGTLVYLRNRPRGGRRAVAVLALLICLAGTAAGVYASFIWWKGWPPIGPLARSPHAAGATMRLP